MFRRLLSVGGFTLLSRILGFTRDILMAAMLGAGTIVRPIRRMTRWSQRIAAGDLGLPEIQAPANEIGVLRDGMRAAVTSLRAA